MKTKKYQAGGTPRSEMESKRPRMRPEDLMDGGSSNAPRRSLRPKKRPKNLMQDNAEAGAIARGDRAAEREMMDMPPQGMKKGGKVRGAGMARKGVRPCKMC